MALKFKRPDNGLARTFSMAAIVVVLSVAFGVSPALTQDSINIALHKEVTISSTLDLDFYWNGSRAVDGVKAGVNDTDYPRLCKCCAHTKDKDQDKWLTLDLAEIYLVGRVVVTGRLDTWRANNGHLSGMMVFLRNATERTGSPVYTHGAGNKSQVIKVTLTDGLLARYISLEQPSPKDKPMIVCEIEVYKKVTKCDEGLFGPACSFSCGECSNISQCSNVDGVCMTECMTGWFGSSCTEECGQCSGTRECNMTTGACMSGCKPGWFRDTCIEECGHCSGTGECNMTTGVCISGCMPGWFGGSCTEECGQCSGTGECNMTTGACMSGCKPGWFRDTCIEECGQCSGTGECNMTTGVCISGCMPGWFEETCNSECGHCLEVTDCNMATGICENGCAAGYKNQYCKDEHLIGTSELQSPPTIVGISGSLGTVTVLVLIVIAVWKRRQRGILQKKNDADEKSDASIQNDNRFQAIGVDSSNNYENWVPSKKVAIHDLYDYISRRLADESDRFVTEYDNFPRGLTDEHVAALLPINKGKNRYKDIVAYDRTRVTLHSRNLQESDYINACFIRGYQKERKFIASQGPTDNIINDFWEMIWQENVPKIVMLTNLSERGGVKCIQYWPDCGSDMYGDITVTLKEEIQFPDFCIRRLSVKKATAETRVIIQLQFQSWPDKDVPDTPWSLVKFWREVRRQDSELDGPTVVHCSAGIGRTGTFIALDYLLDQAEKEKAVDVSSCVATLRKQRVNMVQTLSQYVYLHTALAEALYIGTLPHLCTEFKEWYNYMRQSDENSTMCRLESQYKMFVRSTGEKPSAVLVTGGPATFHLQAKKLLKNFQGKDAFIVTETPRAKNINVFWDMVIENNVKTILGLTDSELPSTTEKLKFRKKSKMKLSTGTKNVSTEYHGSCSEQVFTVNNQDHEEPVSIRHFQFSKWDGSDVPLKTNDVLDLLSKVLVWQPYLSEAKPILLHSPNKRTRCFIICVLLNELKSIEMDGNVNILRSFKSIMTKDGDFVETTSYNQFKFCHDVILEFLEQRSLYGNSSS